MWFLIGVAIGLSVDPSYYQTQAEYEQGVTKATDAITPFIVLSFLVLYAVLARKVSYRWFDTFFQLIPIYGISWPFRIAWRVAYLPHRDWSPRPDEPSQPGAWWSDPTPSYQQQHFTQRGYAG